MPAPDLTLSIDPTVSTIPPREADGMLAFSLDGYLSVYSGLPLGEGLGYAGFNNDQFVNGAIQAADGGQVLQTMTTAAYEHIHLVAGSTLVIQSEFFVGDLSNSDESFALLKNNATGDISGHKIANVQDYVDSNGNTRWNTVFAVATTGDYSLLVGAADVGSVSSPSILKIEGLSMVAPGGSYAVTSAGVQLADGSVYGSDGGLHIGDAVVPTVLSNSSAAVVSALQTQLAQGLISQDGAGIVSHDSGGIVSHDSGGIVSHDSGGIVSHDSGGLTSPTVAGLSGAELAQIGASLVQGNAFEARAFAAVSAAGLASHNYGVQSIDGPTTPVPAAVPPAPSVGAPVPGAEVNLSAAIPHNFQVNVSSPSAIADLGNGRYVVAFSGRDPVNGTLPIEIQVVNADGSTAGPAVRVDTPQASGDLNRDFNPSVATLKNGSFVVAYENDNHAQPGSFGGLGKDLFAQQFHADGSKSGVEFEINSVEVADHAGVKVAALADGGFVAVWGQGNALARVPSTIRSQEFNADGSKRGAQQVISGNAVLADLSRPSVAATSDGGFAVAFQGTAPNPVSGGTVTGIGSLKYDAAGNAASRNPNIVAISTDGTLLTPTVATLSNGDVAFAWIDAKSSTVYSLVTNSLLVPQQANPTVVTKSAGIAFGAPSVAALGDGRFVVGWTDFAQNRSGAAEGQIVNHDNTLSGASFHLYAPGGGDREVAPGLLQLSTGTLVATTVHESFSAASIDVRALPIAVGGSAPVTAPAPVRTLVVGSAVDGYISGGTVFADANGNGIQDAGEISAKTTELGAFVLAAGAKGPLVLTGGTDVVTGRAFTDRYTAPAGSKTVDALTTLVQRVMAAGADIGTAQMKVTTALGLLADAAVTQVDPVVASQNNASGQAILLADALVSDVSNLARAAGSADPLGAFAAKIASQPGFTSFDPSSVAALAAAGLSGQVLADTSAIAGAIKALLATKGTADAGSPSTLADDVNRVEVLVQTGAAPALAAAIGTGTTAAVAAAYTGASLDAKFSGAGTTPGTIAPATLGVYRFFDSNYGTHFFTASASERDSILANRPDLVSEGVGLSAIDPASHDPNAVAVYRFFDTKFGTHFFTASAGERDQVISGRPDLTFEGIGFYEHTTQQAGDVPVYRFFDRNFGTHFYTADAGERANINATLTSGLVDEGVGFYAPKTAT